MTTTHSMTGFKYPGADLHRKSPKILLVSAVTTTVLVAVGLHAPLINRELFEKKVAAPPVIIQLTNIPETRQQAAVPAPKLAMPLEVSDDVMLDDITIDDTSLDMNTAPTRIAPPVIAKEAPLEPEAVEEEIFEFFAVEEAPERLTEVAPEYPRAAQSARIQGTVFVRALVGVNGAVEQAEILKGPELLHDAAIKAALATRFKPAKQNDMPVKCWVQMRFSFELEE